MFATVRLAVVKAPLLMSVFDVTTFDVVVFAIITLAYSVVWKTSVLYVVVVPDTEIKSTMNQINELLRLDPPEKEEKYKNEYIGGKKRLMTSPCSLRKQGPAFLRMCPVTSLSTTSRLTCSSSVVTS